MQHVVQHVASNVASNVVQQVAAFNTYRAVCKFVACNSQQFRTNPILLSVACNKFKYWVQQPIKTRLSDHVTRRVWWLDLSKKGTPSSLTNLSCGALLLGCFRARLSPRADAELWHVSECGGYPWIWGQFNDRWAFKDSKWRISCFSLTLSLCLCVHGCDVLCPSKKLFSSRICVCPGPKGAYSCSLSGGYMLSNFRMHRVIMLVEILLWYALDTL